MNTSKTMRTKSSSRKTPKKAAAKRARSTTEAPERPESFANSNSEPPARPDTIRRSIAKQLSRDRVLQAAAQVFSEPDAAKASVEDILRAASVSRRTFYKMFKSKEDVLAALYEMVSRLMLEASRRALEIAPTAKEAVDQSIDMFLGLAETDGTLMRILESESMRHGSPAAEMREANIATLCDLIAARLQRELGRDVDPLIARGVLHSLEGISLFVRQPASADSPAIRARARLAARQICHAAFAIG